VTSQAKPIDAPIVTTAYALARGCGKDVGASPTFGKHGNCSVTRHSGAGARGGQSWVATVDVLY
jgi:hypothetical protein